VCGGSDDDESLHGLVCELVGAAQLAHRRRIGDGRHVRSAQLRRQHVQIVALLGVALLEATRGGRGELHRFLRARRRLGGLNRGRGDRVRRLAVAGADGRRRRLALVAGDERNVAVVRAMPDLVGAPDDVAVDVRVSDHGGRERQRVVAVGQQNHDRRGARDAERLVVDGVELDTRRLDDGAHLGRLGERDERAFSARVDQRLHRHALAVGADAVHVDLDSV
jgi:hypothetical protein